MCVCALTSSLFFPFFGRQLRQSEREGHEWGWSHELKERLDVQVKDHENEREGEYFSSASTQRDKHAVKHWSEARMQCDLDVHPPLQNVMYLMVSFRPSLPFFATPWTKGLTFSLSFDEVWVCIGVLATSFLVPSFVVFVFVVHGHAAVCFFSPLACLLSMVGVGLS